MFTCISNTNGSHIPRRLISKLEEVFWGDKDVRRSPLRHLLKSNATPSDSEVITIRALITDAEAWIEELHCRFPRRDRASKVIETQLLKSIEVHRALLSPVRYLPSEILQEIFLHYADHRSCPCGKVAKMPWRLGHISHRWRRAALSLPSLWDNIPQFNILLAKPKRSEVQALICLIQRSRTSPTLKFHITGFGSLRKIPKSPIFEEIILHSERIEQLRISINKGTMPFFQELKGRLPNLRFLRVHMDANMAPVFDISETVEQFAIGELDHSSRSSILLPWSQITHFESNNFGKVCFITLLYTRQFL